MSHRELPKTQVIEIFGPTIQGEGLMTGTVTHFLRTGGCGLRCSWCDSMYAVLPEEIKKNRTLMTVPEMLAAIKCLAPAPYITLTGGDPAIQEHLGPLIMHLNMEGYKVAIETQGQYFPDWLTSCDVITFSPKGPSSGNIVEIEPLAEWLWETWGVKRRTQKVCIKVVVFDEGDFNYAMDVYDRLQWSTYDSFYVTAGTPLGDFTPEERVSRVLKSQSNLAGAVLSKAQTVRFNDKFHVGHQQHVLLWPGEEKGV